MRTILALVALCGACDDAPATTEAAETARSDEAPEPAASTPTPTPSAAETTSGFIEAKVDGELKRYEYLPAGDNHVTTRTTVMTGRANADSEEGMALMLIGWDVRAVELPMVFKRDVRAAVRGDIAAASRMPSLQYTNAEGTVHMLVFDDESLECQSLEGSRLECTFSGTARPRAGDTSIEITEGRAEVELVSDATADALIEGTVGAAADESTERVQEIIDRRRGN